jgi:hypothetical protein
MTGPRDHDAPIWLITRWPTRDHGLDESAQTGLLHSDLSFKLDPPVSGFWLRRLQLIHGNGDAAIGENIRDGL